MFEFYVDHEKDLFVISYDNEVLLELTQVQARKFRGISNKMSKAISKFIDLNSDKSKDEINHLYYKDQAIKALGKGNFDRARYYADKFIKTSQKVLDIDDRNLEKNFEWYTEFLIKVDSFKKAA